MSGLTRDQSRRLEPDVECRSHINAYDSTIVFHRLTIHTHSVVRIATMKSSAVDFEAKAASPHKLIEISLFDSANPNHPVRLQ